MLKDLRTLYELRKIMPLEHRRSIARLFVVRGKFGLVDASGVLWPIYFRPAIKPPKPLDVMEFSSSLFRPDGADANKYQDDGYFLAVEEIYEVVNSQEEWKNSYLPSPVPNAHFFDAIDEPNHTFYFEPPHKERIQKIALKNTALRRIEDFFLNHGFMRVETPMLVPSGGVERYLAPFQTQYQDHRKNTWVLNLPTSPEFALKKFLTEGHKKIFQIARSFRSEGQLSVQHEPEFTMLEWYRVSTDLNDVIDDTKNLIEVLCKSLPTKISVEDLKWKHFSIDDLFKMHLGFGLTDVQSEEDFFRKAQPVSVSVQEADDWDTLFSKVMMDCIEPHIAKTMACVVTGFPKQMSALARIDERSCTAERFEVYLNGIEICNGYHELSDAKELLQRFENVHALRPDLQRDAIFEETMLFGLPPSCGNALGIDRLISVLCGVENIASFYPFHFLSQFPSATVADE